MPCFLKTGITGTFLFLLFIHAGAQSPPAKRPTDLWAFRSVLDGVPRILTLALHENLYAGYDTYFCGLTKVWKSGVLKQGPVYNQKHGPQPLSKGGKYLDQPLKESAWFFTSTLLPSGALKNCPVQFKGYRFDKGKIALRYQLNFDSVRSAEVEEWPEYLETPTGPVLERYFVWVQPPPADVQVYAEIVADGLAKPESLVTKGEFQWKSRTEKFAPGRSFWSVQGYLKIPPLTSTTVLLSFDPAFLP